MNLEQAGRAVANAAFDISAIQLRPHNPFLWASGTFNPIYNDNRKHLRYPGNRRMIMQALELLVRDEMEGDRVDLVTGTSTSGIAPATALANLLNVPISILIDDEPHVYDIDDAYSYIDDIDTMGVDVIISTCPSSIIPAVLLADRESLPFAYIRSSKKGHGLKQQVEGRLYEGERAILFDFHNGESYADSALAELEKTVEVAQVHSEFMELSTHKVDGMVAAHVEDLISTAGSCTKEIKVYQELGAQVALCAAIFSYDLPKGLQRFADVNTVMRAAFNYATMLDVAIERGEVTEDDRAMLAGWRLDQPNWGANNGFPPYK